MRNEIYDQRDLTYLYNTIGALPLNFYLIEMA